MGDIAKLIIDLVVAAIEAAVRTGKSFRETLADSLEDAAQKIRDGRLNIDDAVERAREDQDRIDTLRKRGAKPAKKTAKKRNGQ